MGHLHVSGLPLVLNITAGLRHDTTIQPCPKTLKWLPFLFLFSHLSKTAYQVETSSVPKPSELLDAKPVPKVSQLNYVRLQDTLISFNQKVIFNLIIFIKTIYIILPNICEFYVFLYLLEYHTINLTCWCQTLDGARKMLIINLYLIR